MKKIKEKIKNKDSSEEDSSEEESSEEESSEEESSEEESSEEDSSEEDSSEEDSSEEDSSEEESSRTSGKNSGKKSTNHSSRNSSKESSKKSSKKSSKNSSEEDTDESGEDESEEESSEQESDEDNSNKIDHFKDNKKESGFMIPVMISTCNKIQKIISQLCQNKKKPPPNKFMDHYLDCGNCSTIDNNNLQLKYSYIKSKKNKEEFNVVDFDDIEEQFEAYQSMQVYEMDDLPKLSTFNINYIRDNGSEYNNYVLIYWYCKK
jgi:DNA mismatch repair ATPase MutL